ncbi:MAG: hypothetical protein R3190_01515, partial [Thermoanaerobaculia bacterium]|nr:hypothetical protein [Thermoanaerobaculia bacterium]
MKVLLVTAQLVPDIGGIAQSTARLASGLGRQGNDVLVITKRQRDTRPVGMGAVTRRRLRGGIPVIEVPQAWAHPDGIGLGIERLVAETRRFQPDVV